MAVTPIRLEPFGRYGRLIANQANKARSYSPDRRSRPPDPLRRSKRPARISPSGRVSFFTEPPKLRPRLPDRPLPTAVPLSPRSNRIASAGQPSLLRQGEAIYDQGSDSVCNSGTTDVRAQSIVACA